MKLILIKHLSGQHNQQTHGRGWNSDRARDAQGRFSRSGSAGPKKPSRAGSGGYRKAARTSVAEWYADGSALYAIPEDTAGPMETRRDPRLLEIWRRQGFASKPEVADEARLQKEIAAGGVEVWRGMSGQDSDTYARQFLSGDEPFPGIGIYANGTYTSTERHIAEGYARNVGKLSYGGSKKGGSMVRAVLRHDARVVEMEDLGAIVADVQMQLVQALMKSGGPDSEEFKQLVPLVTVAQEPGRVASMLGYDAVVHRFPGVDDEYVILNRTAVLVQPDPIEVPTA